MGVRVRVRGLQVGFGLRFGLQVTGYGVRVTRDERDITDKRLETTETIEKKIERMRSIREKR
jgi:hypothetical protein